MVSPIVQQRQALEADLQYVQSKKFDDHQRLYVRWDGRLGLYEKPTTLLDRIWECVARIWEYFHPMEAVFESLLGRVDAYLQAETGPDQLLDLHKKYTVALSALYDSIDRYNELRERPLIHEIGNDSRLNSIVYLDRKCVSFIRIDNQTESPISLGSAFSPLAAKTTTRFILPHKLGAAKTSMVVDGQPLSFDLSALGTAMYELAVSKNAEDGSIQQTWKVEKIARPRRVVTDFKGSNLSDVVHYYCPPGCAYPVPPLDDAAVFGNPEGSPDIKQGRAESGKNVNPDDVRFKNYSENYVVVQLVVHKNEHWSTEILGPQREAFLGRARVSDQPLDPLNDSYTLSIAEIGHPAKKSSTALELSP